MTENKNPTFEDRLLALERTVTELTVLLKSHCHTNDGKIAYRLD